MAKVKCDFSGYATKHNLKCTDGRTIMPDAFKDNDGMTVPLVWHHIHDEPDNVLGHALLENRPDGVYAYGIFNNTPRGQIAKTVVQSGDIQYLSIYANDLIEKSKNVVHGMIREVSLVMAGANPGAKIDSVIIEHADGSRYEPEDEGVITSGEKIIIDLEKEEKEETEVMQHAADSKSSDSNNGDKTLGDVFDTLNEEQKVLVYALIAQAIDENADGGNAAQHSDTGEEGESNTMKHNVFDQDTKEAKRPTLTHADFEAIVAGTQKTGGSFRDAFIAHTAPTYGIENIDYLFPEAQSLTSQPIFIKRDQGWVAQVINGTFHTPFSRIKTTLADITGETARALGYTKGALKKDEVISLLKRVTTPATIYKKQKLDRDDIIDITDFDVVVWLKAEMRMMLDEELARAILVGDGRAAESEDKINETNIRPIWTDSSVYVHYEEIAEDADANAIIDDIARARAFYKGSGEPTMFTTSVVLSDMLLMRDDLGRRIYATQGELEAALRVSKIVEVPVMEGLTRTTGTGPTEKHLELLAIVVNLKDYALGADKGGQVSLFEDFDIDYNQQKYLMETRVSGALTLPASALVFEQLYTPAQ